MSDKLEALSQPVAWVLGTPSCKHLTADKEYADWYLEHGSTASSLYSKEYVTALLTALKLEQEQSAYYERHMWHFHGLAESETKRADAAEQRLSIKSRIASEAVETMKTTAQYNADMREENESLMLTIGKLRAEREVLEQRLQQPIKLPEPIGWTPPSGRAVLLKSEVIEAIRAAGGDVVKP
ncbi:hypothetical protein [Serratia fonticola]